MQYIFHDSAGKKPRVLSSLFYHDRASQAVVLCRTFFMTVPVKLRGLALILP